MMHTIKIQNHWYRQIGEAEQIAGQVVVFDIHLGKKSTCPKASPHAQHNIGFLRFRVFRVIKTGSGKYKRATVIFAAVT